VLPWSKNGDSQVPDLIKQYLFDPSFLIFPVLSGKPVEIITDDASNVSILNQFS
jgi:hypothetical protein